MAAVERSSACSRDVGACWVGILGRGNVVDLSSRHPRQKNRFSGFDSNERICLVDFPTNGDDILTIRWIC